MGRRRAMGAENGSAEVVRFSGEWMEEYLDVVEHDDSRDPTFSRPVSRDELRNRVLSRMQSSTGHIEAHFLAIHEGRGVGSARAVVAPSCEAESRETATLSLMVSPSHRGLGLGTRLLNRVCDEMASQGVKWMEIGVLDTWEGWQRFLRKHGFAPCDVSADAVLRSDVEVQERPAETGTTIRPIRLPEERARVLEIYNCERSQDLPRECAVVPGQPAWWEVEPFAGHFDPEGFLVAEEREGGELVGYVSASFLPGDDPQALVDYVDVVKGLLGTGLRERLLIQAVMWLRRKGAADIVSRVHSGFRDEEELFKRVGFELENRATVWRRTTAPADVKKKPDGP
jgi:GNAT superfamily N-acetyltransferase